jgi:hypothetical protein
MTAAAVLPRGDQAQLMKSTCGKMQGLGGCRPRTGMTPEPNREQRCDAGQALVGIRGLFRFSSGSSRTVMHPPQHAPLPPPSCPSFTVTRHPAPSHSHELRTGFDAAASSSPARAHTCTPSQEYPQHVSHVSAHVHVPRPLESGKRSTPRGLRVANNRGRCAGGASPPVSLLTDLRPGCWGSPVSKAAGPAVPPSPPRWAGTSSSSSSAFAPPSQTGPSPRPWSAPPASASGTCGATCARSLGRRRPPSSG